MLNWLSLDSVPSQDETIGPDPFYDLEQHALLGVANISLECLIHDIEFVYDAPVVAPTGKVGRGGEGGRERNTVYVGAINLQVLCMKKREENRNLTKSYNLVGVPAVAACCGCLLWLPAVAAYF